MQFFFALTLLTSATLLFFVQPMFAKMVLPLLGGTPAVWNTCMVFYQAVLLLGYVYAHVSTRWLGTRRQAVLHLAILCLPWLVLPIAVANIGTPPTVDNPIPWLLTLMAVSVGLPFFAVSASAPMLQAWFADTGHPSAKDPYFLYAASNLGSMVALLGYPLAVEPIATLGDQAWAWSAGYGLLMAMTLGCAVFLWRCRQGTPVATEESSAAAGTGSLEGVPTMMLRLRWLALSFVPSSLMLGVTTFVSTDIASVPLLWVIPLALYLLTFILVFSHWPTAPYRWGMAMLARVRRTSQSEYAIPMDRAIEPVLATIVRMLHPHGLALLLQPALAVLSIVMSFQSAADWMGAMIVIQMATFFVTAMVCHGELADSRPNARYLTEFYIWMSVGGVLGGLFNALVAPLTFSTILEYPLVVVLGCLLRPSIRTRLGDWVVQRINRFAAGLWPEKEPSSLREWFVAELPVVLLDLLPVVVFLGGLAVLSNWLRIGGNLEAITIAIKNVSRAIGYKVSSVSAEMLVFAVGGVVAFLFQMRPIRFGLCVGVIMLSGLFWSTHNSDTIFLKRSFFGVLRVREGKEERKLPTGEEYTRITHTLVHGTTNHGEQWFDSNNPRTRRKQITYYHPSGPLGHVMHTLANRPATREIGVIGLGTGSTAAYGKPGQHITYFEIDPAVEQIAWNTDYFTYLSDCRAKVDVVLGDARLSLVDQPDGRFDVLILDAFSSDAIPIHLLTREALALYLKKLAPDGLLLLHISNRHLDLAPVVGNLARDAKVVCRYWQDSEDEEDEGVEEGKFASDWVLIVRQRERLGLLDADPDWKSIEPKPKVGVWTDDFSNILTVLSWLQKWQKASEGPVAE